MFRSCPRLTKNARLPFLETIGSVVLMAILFLGLASPLVGAEYFVAKQGDDKADGTSEASAFATIQKGVSVLVAGDTLTIGPGEYAESVRRDGLGELGKPTVIRARIPGTVLLRGDVPVGPFRKVEGESFVYEAPESRAVLSVSQADNLRSLRMRPNLMELAISPGSWLYDAEKKALYVSPSDAKSADVHSYRATIVSGDGFYLANAKDVRIQGLAVTGYNDNATTPSDGYRTDNAGMWTVWGILLFNSTDCVIEDCVAYLNGGGIAVNNSQSVTTRGGNNRIVRCTAYGNESQMGGYQSSGIGLYNSNGDEIRDCLAYTNGAMGIRTYLQMLRPARIVNSVAWNNLYDGAAIDIHLKDMVGKNGELTSVENSVAAAGLKAINVVQSTVPARGKTQITKPEGNLFLEGGASSNLETNKEFADPVNLDFRLQSNSTSRGSGPNGSDLGAFPFKGDVYFLSNSGNDEGGGQSVTDAWKTLARAVRSLKPGDTLYLEPGVYDGDVTLTLAGEVNRLINIRGRGAGRAVLSGSIKVADARNLRFERVNFTSPLDVSKSEGVVLHNCQFLGSPEGLRAQDTRDLRVTHCLFTRFSKAAIALSGEKNSGLFLSGNLYDNVSAPALLLPDAKSIAFSDYNSYANGSTAAETSAGSLAFAALGSGLEAHSQEIRPELETRDHVVTIKNALAFVGGPLGKPIGTYRLVARSDKAGLIEGPAVHSVSATTANIEWKSTAPLMCRMGWGETPACATMVNFEADRFGTYSLTNLKPGTTYYFQIKAVQTPPTFTEGEATGWIEVDSKPIAFTTASTDAPPATYYVAPEGDNKSAGTSRAAAWKTIMHAASKVNVGDTVLIASGTYPERVIIRATGKKDAPITFKSLPGEKVWLTGANKKLSNGFAAAAKNDLRFDGFYFSNYSLSPTQGWFPGLAGDFGLYLCRNIQISRCFSEGRGGTTSRTVNAYQVSDLTVKNMVSLNKTSGAFFINRCPNFRMENCVIARPMISSVYIFNEGEQAALLKDSIFTDSLAKKAKINATLFEFGGKTVHENNVYFLREPATRELSRGRKLSDLGEFIRNPFVGDPRFAGVTDSRHGTSAVSSNFSPDLLTDAKMKLDFDSFFATDPEVVRRGIGLQPEAFADYKFNR